MRPSSIRRVILVSTALGLAAIALAVLDRVLVIETIEGESRYFETPLPVAALGIIIGTTYALTAASLVLVYRQTGILHLALPALGAFVAVALGTVFAETGVPYWQGFAVALGVAAGLSVLTGSLTTRC